MILSLPFIGSRSYPSLSLLMITVSNLVYHPYFGQSFPVFSRVRYCNSCKASVRGFDHHCPAFGNCIGFKPTTIAKFHILVDIRGFNHMHMQATRITVCLCFLSLDLLLLRPPIRCALLSVSGKHHDWLYYFLDYWSSYHDCQLLYGLKLFAQCLHVNILSTS